MRKLGKRTNLQKETIEAYCSSCSCSSCSCSGCTCPNGYEGATMSYNRNSSSRYSSYTNGQSTRVALKV
ncbi:MAG: CLI_3235 family bacteriocin precursor [Clostridia bacterium]|nr:CLI_3235 family bacteriocin precursor [Clostridia bacterium]